MEFNPGDRNVGKRGELAFVQELLAAGKQPFFLMPPGQHANTPGTLPGGKTQEENMRATLALWASQGVTTTTTTTTTPSPPMLHPTKRRKRPFTFLLSRSAQELIHGCDNIAARVSSVPPSPLSAQVPLHSDALHLVVARHGLADPCPADWDCVYGSNNSVAAALRAARCVPGPLKQHHHRHRHSCSAVSSPATGV